MSKQNSDKPIQNDFFGNLFKSVNIKDFLDDEINKKRIRSGAAPMDIPPVAPIEGAAGPAVGGMGSPAPGGPPPIGGAAPGGPPLPIGGAAPGGPPPAAPQPLPIQNAIPEGIPQMGPKQDNATQDKINTIFETVSQLEDEIRELKHEKKLKDLEEYVYSNLEDLKRIVNDFRDKKVPLRSEYDTEGVYREKLYGLVTEVLDKHLPELFEEIPDYSFIATQISRVFEDGTVCDATVTLGITVSRDGNRYDFKCEVFIGNGLIHMPYYISRGPRNIPLTKDAIQRELNSFSYRKINIDTPYEKENIYNNVGENILKRQNLQKEYDSTMSQTTQSTLPAKHKWETQQRTPYNI
jgi:FtsZ-binding cell division protein ZapB